MFFNHIEIICVLMAVIEFSIAYGRPATPNHQSVITKFNIADWKPDGYSFEYATSSGISRKERGYLKKDSTGNEKLVTEGEFSYTGDDNEVYTVNYIADENGYRPKLSHKTAGKTGSTPDARNLKGGGDFVFPDSNSVTTRKPTQVGSSTESPTSTAEYPFITTLFPEYEGAILDMRFDPSPGLIASILGR